MFSWHEPQICTAIYCAIFDQLEIIGTSVTASQSSDNFLRTRPKILSNIAIGPKSISKTFMWTSVPCAVVRPDNCLKNKATKNDIC